MVINAMAQLTHGTFLQSDVGLPVYRPDILSPKPEHRGTLLVSHTFEDPSFLLQLKAASRKYGVKITGILHAAMLKAVYEMSDTKPSAQEIYHSGSPMDLRNGHLLPEYCDRTKYVNLAVAIQSINVPCILFKTDQGNEEQFWKTAACISNQWEAIKSKKDLAKTAESDAKALVESLISNRYITVQNRSKSSLSDLLPCHRNSSNPSNTKPRTCPTFASDPPGSPGLRGIYPISGLGGLNLVLDSYQMSSEQTQTVV